MRTDAEIRHEGVAMLIKTLGPVEAERFIALINRERLDYTEWRKNQWLDETVATLAEKAKRLRLENKNES